jgi:hypothetical protein
VLACMNPKNSDITKHAARVLIGFRKKLKRGQYQVYDRVAARKRTDALAKEECSYAAGEGHKAKKCMEPSRYIRLVLDPVLRERRLKQCLGYVGQQVRYD